MQDKFGKKLEEARIRRGISIRQASDYLKIRADFLLSFESDHGNFDMPIVYKTGFIKLYAQYLKLNPEEIVDDFNACHQSDNKKARQKEERELLGRIELISPEPPLTLDSHNANFNSSEEPEPSPSKKFSKELKLPTTWPKNFNVKTGLFFGCSFAILTLMAFVINSFIHPSETKSKTQASSQSQAELAGQIQHIAEQLVLLGEDNIHVVVRQEQDKQRLFSGNIDKDHPVTVTRKGPVKIHSTDLSKLSIQRANGKIFTPERSGAGLIEI